MMHSEVKTTVEGRHLAEIEKLPRNPMSIVQPTRLCTKPP